MNTLTSAPCTSRTSPKNKEPGGGGEGTERSQGIVEARTHTCNHPTPRCGLPREGKVTRKKRVARLRRNTDFSDSLSGRSTDARLDTRRSPLQPPRRTKDENETRADSKNLPRSLYRSPFSPAVPRAARLIFLLRLMQTGIGISREMEVLRKETTGREGVHCHSVIIKKIDFKSRMQSEEERDGRRKWSRCGLNEW